MIRALLFGGLVLWTTGASALELYSFIGKSCRVNTGVILEVGAEEVHVLGIDGKATTLSRADLKSIVIFNTIENPFREFTLDTFTREHLKTIYLDSEDTPYLTGWPVKFVEELVIFFDIKGNQFVIDLERVTRVRPAEDLPPVLEVKGVRPAFDHSEVLSDCPDFKATTGMIRPTRIISDQIQMREFLGNFSEGFDRLESYQERTYLYALPFLYERKTRLIFYSDVPRFEQPLPKTFLFQWARGRPYHFQSFYQLGNFAPRYAPSDEGYFALRSELKSHVFHAAFMGNLSAMAAGSEYFIISSEVLDRKPSDDERAHFAPGFNYMAIMGADYLQWSFGVGTYFPTFGFIADNSKREVLAAKVQPVFRLMHTRERWNAMVLFSQGSYGKSDPNDLDLTMDLRASVVGVIKSFALKYEFIRADFSFKATQRMTLFSDLIWIRGDYRETTALSALNTFDFDHRTLAGGLRYEFGEYVAMSVKFSQIDQKQDFLFDNAKRSEPRSKMQMGGVFEFIF